MKYYTSKDQNCKKSYLYIWDIKIWTKWNQKEQASDGDGGSKDSHYFKNRSSGWGHFLVEIKNHCRNALKFNTSMWAKNMTKFHALKGATSRHIQKTRLTSVSSNTSQDTTTHTRSWIPIINTGSLGFHTYGGHSFWCSPIFSRNNQ